MSIDAVKVKLQVRIGMHLLFKSSFHCFPCSEGIPYVFISTSALVIESEGWINEAFINVDQLAAVVGQQGEAGVSCVDKSSCYQPVCHI